MWHHREYKDGCSLISLGLIGSQVLCSSASAFLLEILWGALKVVLLTQEACDGIL